jgi:FKBP-type peptidyl-prolyl cis-trans isomerase
MKKLTFLLFLFLTVFLLHAKAIQEDIDKADEKARLSYAFGMLYGADLRTTPLEFDYNAFTNGFRVMFENTEPQFTEDEALEIVKTAMQNAMDKVSAENRIREEQFLLANRQRTGVRVTPSGLQYEIINETEGEKPQGNSLVRVSYTGSYIDGEIFDRSENEGAYIPLEMVIPGWNEGIQLMSTGSVYRLFIPSELAYGRSGIQNVIPPYSTLIFVVELLEIMDNSDYSEEEFEF